MRRQRRRGELPLVILCVPRRGKEDAQAKGVIAYGLPLAKESERTDGLPLAKVPLYPFAFLPRRGMRRTCTPLPLEGVWGTCKG